MCASSRSSLLPPGRADGGRTDSAPQCVCEHFTVQVAVGPVHRHLRRRCRPVGTLPKLTPDPAGLVGVAGPPAARATRRPAPRPVARATGGPGDGALGTAPRERPLRSTGGASSRSGIWSGRLDSNQRPLDPQSSALPGCATPRLERPVYQASPASSSRDARSRRSVTDARTSLPS